MAKARLFVPSAPLEILKLHMRNTDVRAQLIDSSAAMLKQGLLNRALNNFPLLISQNELDKQTDNFIDILKYVSCNISKEDDSMHELDALDKRQLETTVTGIALLGCKSLLKNSEVNPDLIELLNWQQFQSKLDIGDLISAFTAETFLDIIKNTSLKVDIDPLALSVVADFINKNQRTWVIHAIHQAGHAYTVTPVLVENQNQHADYSTAGIIAAAAFAGFMLIGGAATAAILAEQYSSPHTSRKR